MGCCFSNDDDKDSQGSERDTLLNNPHQVDYGSHGIGYQAPMPHEARKSDEQSALNQILHRTANDVIDVAAIDSYHMEPHELMDRARQYSSRLQMVCSTSGRHQYTTRLPAGVAAPQMVLSAQPLSTSEIQMITAASEKVSQALKDVKVRHKEDLVVPFGVP